MSAAWSTPEQSGSSPTTSTPSSQPRKSAARVLACVLCQQRKIKCNRKFPCANCTRSKASCVPATVSSGRRKRRFPERELLDRLSKYEDLLRRNNVEFEPLHRQGKTTSSNVEGTSHSTEELPEAPEVEQPSTPKPEQVYEAKNFWHTMSQGFRDPDNDSDSSQDDVREGLVRSAWDLLYTNKDHLLLGSRKTPVDIFTLHPEPVQIFRLRQLYLDNVNPLLKVTHAPSLQGRIVEAAGNVSRTSPVLETLMFSIYCVAVQSLAEDDILTSHHFGCEQALLNCGFLRTSDRDCLTALFLYLVSVGPRTDPRSLSSMLGVAVRIAQRMGIDSESSNARCGVLEAEMRRRLWWALVLFDTRMGELANHRSVTLNPTWDCAVPLNANDSDLWAAMKAPPAAAQGKCTDALFAAVHLDFTTPALKPIASHAASTDDGGGLEALERRLNDAYLRCCDPDNPLHFTTIWTTRSLLARYRLITYNTQAPLSSAQPSAGDAAHRDAALSSALALLAADTALAASPLAAPFRWLFAFHFPFPAYVHAAQDLKRRPFGARAEEAWRVMGDHYDARFASTTATADDNPLFEVFAAMVLQAWEPREEALRERGERRQEVLVPPRIVVRFREKVAEMAAAATKRKANAVPDAGLQEQQQRNTAETVGDVGGLMPMAGLGGHDGLLYGGMDGQGGYAEMAGLGGFSNLGVPGQFPLDGGVGQLGWAGMDWGFGNHGGG